MRKITNQANYVGPQTESSKLPSATIPDQTMPLRTLIERYVRGIPTAQKIPIWDKEDLTTDDYLPDPKTLDLAERQEMAQNFAEEIRQYKEAAEQFEASQRAKNALKIDSTQTQSKTQTQNQES